METRKEQHRRLALADWVRIAEVIDQSQLSVNAFALKLGLQRGENLYQIRRGNNRISRDVAERIHRFYPQYSMGWLLTGAEPEPERNPALFTYNVNSTAF